MARIVQAGSGLLYSSVYRLWHDLCKSIGMKRSKAQQKPEEKRIVLLRADGVHQILGRTNAAAVDLCNKSSFLPLMGSQGMSLIKMFPRYALYRELVVPAELKRFDGSQR